MWKTKGLAKKAIQEPYILMNKYIQASNRDIVYSLCQYGLADVWEWGQSVGGNSWRTTWDIVDTWKSVNKLLNKQKKLAPYAGPGHWNDPDMLVLGVVGWNNDSRKCRLTEDEQRLHFTMWSMLASPLLLGCDLTKIDPFTMSLITNDDIIALNQDHLGKQAVLLEEKGKIQLWKKELANGDIALAFCNLGGKGKFTTYDLGKASTEKYSTTKDLWTGLQTTLRDNKLTVAVPTHGVVCVRLSKP
jgi:alpha-galactosidase